MTPRVLQIHVTRKCNLKCLHCYSESGPDQTDKLNIDYLIPALSDAKRLGYDMISVSGGEPFLYPDLAVLLRTAKQQNLRTAVVTNGMYLDAARLLPLRDCLDVLAVSMDGAPERHNRMRANPRAFETVAGKIPTAVEVGIPFGILMTLTEDNIEEIDAVADFAVKSRAKFLQIVPLELEGRAREGKHAESTPGASSALRAATRAQIVQNAYRGRLAVRMAYQSAETLGIETQSCGREASFADRVHPLTIEPNGNIIPMGHGFSREFMLGKLGDAPLYDLAQQWDDGALGSAYTQLIDTVVQSAAQAAGEKPLTDIAHEMRAAGTQMQSSF